MNSKNAGEVQLHHIAVSNISEVYVHFVAKVYSHVWPGLCFKRRAIPFMGSELGSIRGIHYMATLPFTERCTFFLNSRFFWQGLSV